MTEDEKEFLALLNQQPIRVVKKRDCDKQRELGEDELKILLSIRDAKTKEEACNILKPIYEKYKHSTIVGKRTMPDLIIRCIYFIIFRECTYKIHEDIAREPHNRKLLEVDGTLRRRVLFSSSSRVFQLLGEINSKVQERMGIQPIKDFSILNYQPIELPFSRQRDELFKAMFLNVVYQAEYAMFTDLTGEDTILKDIYYCDREAICSSDCMTINFYNAIILKYKRFCEELKSSVDKLQGSLDVIIKAYRNEMNDKRNQSEGTRKLSNEMRQYKEWVSDNVHPTVPTYPFSHEAVDLESAVQYLLVSLYEGGITSLDILKVRIAEYISKELLWLRLRIQKSFLCWVETADLVKIINNGNLRFSGLQRANNKIIYTPDFNQKPYAKKYTYYENIKDTMNREIEEIRMEYESVECEQRIRKYVQNKEQRVKKGFLFYDYRLKEDEQGAWEFSEFINKNECLWAFVCSLKDEHWIHIFQEKADSSLSINQTGKYVNYLKVRGYNTDVVILTNVHMKGINWGRISKLLIGFEDIDSNRIKEDNTILFKKPEINTGEAYSFSSD